MKIIITGAVDMFYWRLFEGKREVAIAVSGRSYTRRASARRAAMVFLSKIDATDWITVEA